MLPLPLSETVEYNNLPGITLLMILQVPLLFTRPISVWNKKGPCLSKDPQSLTFHIAKGPQDLQRLKISEDPTFIRPFDLFSYFEASKRLPSQKILPFIYMVVFTVSHALYGYRDIGKFLMVAPLFPHQSILLHHVLHAWIEKLWMKHLSRNFFFCMEFF